MTTGIDEFARKLVELVRDTSIDSADVLRNPHSKDPTRLKLNKLDEDCVREVLDLLIPDIVDATIFHLLAVIDGGLIRLHYISGDGVSYDLTEEGFRELAGWFLGECGWVERYSKHPISADTISDDMT